MKTSITIFLLLMSLTIQAQQKPYSIQEFTWLEDNWERQGMKEGTSAMEYWLFENNQIQGKGLSFQGTDTTFVEGLSIQLKDNKVYYVADVPGNDAPTYFEITSLSKTGFVSENSQHDFPKRIEYKLELGTLKVVISDGAANKIFFNFKRK